MPGGNLPRCTRGCKVEDLLLPALALGSPVRMRFYALPVVNEVEGRRRVAIRKVPQTAVIAGGRGHHRQAGPVATEAARRGADRQRRGAGTGGRRGGGRLRVAGQ